MRILRGLTSRLFPCGCIAGVYETYDGKAVTLLDDRHTSCTDALHVEGSALPEVSGMRPHSEVRLDADRQGKA